MSSSETDTHRLGVFRGVPVHDETVTPDLFTGARVVEEYDVNEYASITILYNDDTDEHYYRINEPELDDYEEMIRQRISHQISDDLQYDSANEGEAEELGELVETKARERIELFSQAFWRMANRVLQIFDREVDVLDDAAIDKIIYYIVRDFVHFGKLTPIMDDPHIEDVSCNAPHVPVFVYHEKYQDLMTNLVYEEQELDSFVSSMAQRGGKHISIAEPMVDGSLPDGSRMQLTLSDEISADGSNFTLRKFDDEPFTPIDLINYNTFSLEEMVYLWLAIENNKSLIFAGGTASGKTTSMNAVSLFIPPQSKTITIEDTREIMLRHKNWIKSVTRDSFGGGDVGEVAMFDLLKNALRQRPEYMIVGEIRGSEAQTLFQAMSTGHTTYSTMHADSVESAIHRLENPPIDVPRQMLQALDIMSIQVQTYVNDDKVRRSREIVEVVGIDGTTQQIETRTIYQWNPATDEFEQEGESKVLEKIKRERAWSDAELQTEMTDRRRLLEYLIEHDINDYRRATDIIRSYMKAKDKVMERLEDGTLGEDTQSLPTFIDEQVEGHKFNANLLADLDGGMTAAETLAETIDLEVSDDD